MVFILKLSNFLNNKSSRINKANEEGFVIKKYNKSNLTDDSENNNVGKLGENLAKKYFQNEGYKIIETNAHKRFGEIDIVAQKNGTTIFCEVKTRTSERFGSAVESLTHTKKKRILRMIRYYCLKNRIPEENIRADFIAIQIDDNDDIKLRHFQSIELA